MEVIDLNNEDKKNESLVSEIESQVLKEKKKKNIIKKLKDYVESLSKKQKIILGIAIVLVLTMLSTILFFVITKDNEEELIEDEPVILSMGNYKYVDGTLYFYDSSDNELGSYECLVKDEKTCYMSFKEYDNSLDNFVKIYNDDSELINFVQVYSKLVFVNDNDSLLLYNLDSNEVVGEFSYVIPAYDDLVILSDLNGKYALVDLTNGYDAITEFDYDYIGYIEGETNFVFSKNSDYGIISPDGELLVNDISGSVTNYSDNYIISYNGTTYSLLNYSKDTLLSGYDNIKIYGKYIVVIKESLLYAYDIDFNKINEIGISVDEIDDYTDYLVYSSEYKLLSTKYSLDFEITSDKLVKLGGTSYNVYESFINGSVNYANYISGIWYLYSDEEKTNLLGSYACTAKNTVTDITDTYSNCYIANNTDIINNTNDIIGVTPIVSDKYVFIYDTQTLSLYDSIVVYDLSKEEKIGTYSEINIIDTIDKNESEYFVSDEVTILAENTDGEYGIIQLNSSGAKIVIDFDYVSFDKLNDYYLFTSSSGYNYIFETDGTCLNPNSKIKNEITDYLNGYIIVKVNSNKQIYSTSGTIISDAFKTLMLEDNVYLGIDGDNKIYLYTYDSDTNLFTFENDTSFEYLSFKQVDGNNVSITLYSSENLEIATYYIGVN